MSRHLSDKATHDATIASAIASAAAASGPQSGSLTRFRPIQGSASILSRQMANFLTHVRHVAQDLPAVEQRVRNSSVPQE